MKVFFSIGALSFLFILPLVGQNSVVISGGTTKVIGGSIVLKDTKLNNKSTFFAADGTVEMKGDAAKAQSEIGGTGIYTFNNLTINKATNDVQLAANITVNNQIKMTSGNLDLVANNLTLGTANGTIIDESENSRITSASTGQVIKSMDLNMPSFINPGNMGIIISSSANLGQTEIRRGHNHQTLPTGSSIFRHFTITPTNNTGLDASLTFHYLEGELNGITENALVLLENNNGWIIDGFDNRNTTNNTVSFSGYDALYQYTLGMEVEDADMDGIPFGMDNCPNIANADQADVDNDMVGNVCDMCANGNDMVDANTNGIIDDCECKGTNLSLTGIVNQDSVYVASNTIQSNETLETAKTIIYKANNSITLTTGFHAKTGSSFLATISPCQSLPPFAPLVKTKININTVELAEELTLTASPNPVLTDTKINYFVPETGNITLSIQDLKGQQLALLIDNQRVEKGNHELIWNVSNLAAGMYLLQLASSQGTLAKKLVLASDNNF